MLREGGRGVGFLKGMASSSRPAKFQGMLHTHEHVGVINWNLWVTDKERTWSLEFHRWQEGLGEV